MKVPRLTIGLVRRGYSETGGAEAYLKRLARGMSAAGHEIPLITDAGWPRSEWPWGPITRLRADSALRFADEVEKIRPQERCDLLFSFERIWRCDVFRAGDGIHQAWLQRRDAASSTAKKLLRHFNPKHRETLELERSLFTGGARRVIANSEMVKKEAQQFYHYPATQIDVIPNGVPVADFRLSPDVRRQRRKNLGLASDQLGVLFVGSGWARKGLRFAIAAVDSLGDDSRLLVAGRGRGRKLYAGSVLLLGAVRELPALYAAADVFFVPTDYQSVFKSGPESIRGRLA